MITSLLGWVSRHVRIFPGGSASRVEWEAPESIVYGDALEDSHFPDQPPPAYLVVGGTWKFTPPVSTVLPAGDHVLTATFTPADLKSNKKAQVVVQKSKISVLKAMPILKWKRPDAIFSGTQLSRKQLTCACLDLPGGEYEYKPALRSVCPEGETVLSVTYIPEDHLRENYHCATMEVVLSVLPLKQPTFAWDTPGEIVYGEALSCAQLNAVIEEGYADKGTVAYAPPAGTVLNAIEAAPLTVEFTPFNKVEYKSATLSVMLSIRRAESVLHWPQPEAIYSGALVSKAQLCAACTNLPGGVFRYSVATRTELPVGEHDISVEYTPERAFQKNYFNGRASVRLVVMPLHQPVFSWSPPADIVYSTPLSSSQLCAALGGGVGWGHWLGEDGWSAWHEHGTVTYTPPEGTVLDCTDAVTLHVAFEPNDPLEVLPAERSVTMRVVRADPVLNWPPLEPILMHTLLSLQQQTVVCTWPGHGPAFGEIVYAPAIGAHLEVGTHTLAATFVPSHAYRRNFNSVTITTELRVDKPEPLLHWADPPNVHVGRPLLKRHLCCMCVQAGLPEGSGTFEYDPPLGALLPLGRQLLRVTYTVDPAFEWKYRPASATVYIDIVPPRTPILTWPTPTDLPYGAKLTQFQLNARASTEEGFLYYESPRGTVLPPGEQHVLRVTFIPNDHLEWARVSLEVSIRIFKTQPSLVWEPRRYFYAGMALSADQLCCKVVSAAPIHGVMSYTPGLGAVLAAGEHVLRATFTCDKRHKREYDHTSTSVVLVVAPKVWPHIAWPEPEAIVYGTLLSAAQLCASASVPGRFEYSPPLGTLLNAHPAQALSLTFYPSNPVEHNTVTKQMLLQVKKATPRLHWEPPPFVYIGQAMRAKHLCATCSQPGTIIYCPELGEILPLGKHTMTAIFKPSPEVSKNYTFASCFSTLLVIEEGSLFKMPKRYLEPETLRAFPVHDRQFLLESDTLAWFSSELDCQPAEPVRKVVEKMRAAMASEKNKVRVTRGWFSLLVSPFILSHIYVDAHLTVPL